ncbi:hypothetical protein Tco_0369775 [Tanacetum coccineum]
MRTASITAKPYQGDSSEFYLITGSIYTDQWGTVVIPMQRSVKVKELQERCLIQAFNLKKSMSMLVRRSQVHKTAIKSQDDDKRLCLVDDPKDVQVYIQVKLYGTSSKPKVNDHYNIAQV